MGHKTLILFLLVLSSNVLATVEIPLIYSAPLKKSNFSQIFSTQAIAASGASLLSQILSQTSQLQLLDMYGDGSRTNVNIRGFGDNAAANSLILVDQQPLVTPDTSGANINSIPLTSIQQIEIIPGSGSVLYGDQAVGGIVKITTKPPQKAERNVALAYGSYSTRNAAITLGDVLENNFGYRVMASHFFSNNFRNHNQNQINNASLLLNYDSELSQLTFSYNKYNQHLQLPCALTADEVHADPTQATTNIPFDNQDTDYFTLNFKHYIADWLLEMYGNERLMQGVGAYNGSNGSAIPIAESRNTGAINVKLSGAWHILQRDILPIVGGEFMQGSYALNGTSATQKQFANYGQLEVPILTRLKLILGARYAVAKYDFYKDNSRQNPINRALINDVELLWEANNNLRFFVNRAVSFRFPKVDENVYTINGQPLQTQIGTTYEVGAAANIKNVTTKFSVFQLNIHNEIISVPDPVSNFFVYNENVPATTRKGASLNFIITPLTNFTLTTGYNYVDAKITGGFYSGNTLPFVAKNSYDVTGKYKFSNGINLYLNEIYTGRRYALNDMANRVGTFGGFTIFNFCISYEQPKYNLNLRVNNLTNKLYFGYIVTTYQGNNTATVFYPSSGINTLLSVAFKL